MVLAGAFSGVAFAQQSALEMKLTEWKNTLLEGRATPLIGASNNWLKNKTPNFPELIASTTPDRCQAAINMINGMVAKNASKPGEPVFYGQNTEFGKALLQARDELQVKLNDTRQPAKPLVAPVFQEQRDPAPYVASVKVEPEVQRPVVDQRAAEKRRLQQEAESHIAQYEAEQKRQEAERRDFAMRDKLEQDRRDAELRVEQERRDDFIKDEAEKKLVAQLREIFGTQPVASASVDLRKMLRTFFGKEVDGRKTENFNYAEIGDKNDINLGVLEAGSHLFLLNNTDFGFFDIGVSRFWHESDPARIEFDTKSTGVLKDFVPFDKHRFLIFQRGIPTQNAIYEVFDRQKFVEHVRAELAKQESSMLKPENIKTYIANIRELLIEKEEDAGLLKKRKFGWNLVGYAAETYHKSLFLDYVKASSDVVYRRFGLTTGMGKFLNQMKIDLIEELKKLQNDQDDKIVNAWLAGKTKEWQDAEDLAVLYKVESMAAKVMGQQQQYISLQCWLM